MSAQVASFLAGIPASTREALLRAGRPRRWERGERMIRVEDPADTVIVLLDGAAKVHTASGGGEEVILTLLGPGDLLGEITAVRSHRRTADVTALSPVDGVVVDAEALRQLLSEHPDLSLALLDLALVRLRVADRRRLEAATVESLPRVAARLLEIVERFGRPEPRAPGDLHEVELPMTQDELAAWSGCSRESTARALRTLRSLRVIETGRRRLTVLDLPALRRHAQAG